MASLNMNDLKLSGIPIEEDEEMKKPRGAQWIEYEEETELIIPVEPKITGTPGEDERIYGIPLATQVLLNMHIGHAAPFVELLETITSVNDPRTPSQLVSDTSKIRYYLSTIDTQKYYRLRGKQWHVGKGPSLAALNDKLSTSTRYQFEVFTLLNNRKTLFEPVDITYEDHAIVKLWNEQRIKIQAQYDTDK